MSSTIVHWRGYLPVVGAAAALFTGCVDEAPLGPDRRPGFSDAPAGTVAMSADVQAADLGPCDSLQVPVESKLAFSVYAKGVQIYHWNGTGWSFDGPSAKLSADAEGKSIVGIHYSGPTWESVSGGKLVGTVLKRCTPDPNAIPWLLLGAVSTGPGVFNRVTFIQRVNTVGGTAPSSPGSFTGEEARVPYTTEYLFYRPQ